MPEQYKAPDIYDLLPLPGTQEKSFKTTVGDATAHSGVIPQTPVPGPVQSSWQQWYLAFKSVLPIFVATRLAFLMLDYMVSLFAIDNFSVQTLKFSTLLDAWNHWDTGNFLFIAMHGYDHLWRAAFFPLFPLFIRVFTFLVGNPLLAGLIVSNLAGLGMMMVLYRLLQEDFNQEQASRTVLYLSVFPTAFFLAAAYNETVFLFFALLSFYCIRHEQWWLAGLWGFFAALTRSVGLLLLFPFFYEYLRRCHFRLKSIRFDILSSLLIPVGLGLFALYCYFRYQDALAFSHAQSTWGRKLSLPGYGFYLALRAIRHNAILSFYSIHNMLDLNCGLLMLALVTLCFIGPWKFSKEQRVYAWYALAFSIFLLAVPESYPLALASLSRFTLENFPAFIILAAIGKKIQFNLYYLTLSLTLLAFLLLQFLTGHWIV